jgi:soluble lytic murein transglycosylase
LYGGTFREDSLRLAAYWEKVATGDSTGARAVLLALSEDPDDELARKANFILAKAALDAHDFDGTLEAIALGTPELLKDWATYFQARTYQMSDRPSDAADCFARLASDTVSILAEESMWNLANLILDKGLIDSTIRVVALYRERFPDGYFRQKMELIEASARTLLQEYHEAIECLYRAELLDPTSDEGRQADLKLMSFQRFYNFKPRSWNHDEIVKRLEVLERERAFKQAIAWVEELLDTPHPETFADTLLCWKGNLLSSSGKHRDAIAVLSEHRQRFPNSPYTDDVCYNLGRSQYSRGYDSLAMANLQLAIDRGGDSVRVLDALRLLGVIYTDAKDLEAARPVFEKLVALSEGQSVEREALWRFGWVLWDLSRFDEAERTWTKLGETGEDSDYAPATLYWRARCFEKMKNPPRAQELFQQTRVSFPYSYYAILAERKLPLDAPSWPQTEPAFEQPFDCAIEKEMPSHSMKFCLLEHLGLSDLALREWPAVQDEVGESPGLWWWRAALLEDTGDQNDAWLVIRDHLSSVLLGGGSEVPDLFWRIAYPFDFDDIVQKYSVARPFDAHFVLGIICQESRFRADAVSGAGAVGLMQLMPPTARRLAPKLGLPSSAAKLTNPEHNIALGTAYLEELFQMFSGDSVLVLAAYNAGESAAQAWDAEFGGETDVFIEHIPYRETRLFVKRVLQNIAAYRRLHPDL